MSDPITLQQLVNAGVDAELLSEFMNGSTTDSSGGYVQNRVGDTLPNLAKIIETLLATDIDAARYFVPVNNPGSGSANVIVATVDGDKPVLEAGVDQIFLVPITHTNTGTTTLTIPGVGGGVARPIRTRDNAGLSASTLIANHFALVKYYTTGAVYELIYPQPPSQPIVDCGTAAGSGNALILSPVGGYALNGSGQIFQATCVGPNSSATVTVAVEGVFGGVATPLLMSNGRRPPIGLLKTGGLVQVRVKGSAWELVGPLAVPAATFAHCTTVSTGAALECVLPEGITLNADFTRTVYAVRTVAPQGSGGPSIRLMWANGDEAKASTNLRDKDGNTLPSLEVYWQANDILLFEVLEGGTVRLLTDVDRTTEVLSNLSASLDFDIAPAHASILVNRVTTERWQVTNGEIVYDDPDQHSNADCMKTLMYDLAYAMSQGELESEHVLCAYASKAIVGGKVHEVGNNASVEIGGGQFDGIQLSTNEFAMRMGFTTDGISEVYPDGHPSEGHAKRDFYGFGHGLLQLIPGTASFTMETQNQSTGVWSTTSNLIDTMVRGDSKRGRRATFTADYEIYRSPPTAPVMQGMVRVTQEFIPGTGLVMSQEHRIGRILPYTNGAVEIVEGDILEGGTGGGRVEVVYIPDHNATGTWAGGDRAGTMYVRNLVGTNFVATENLFLGSNVACKAADAVGAQVTAQQSLVGMVTPTVANRCKVPNFPEFPVNREDGTNAPYGMTFTNGEEEIVPGMVIRGMTSLVQATIEYVPDTMATGTWAGNNRAGYLFFLSTETNSFSSSVFATGEDLWILDENEDPLIYAGKAGSTRFNGNLPLASRVQFWHTNDPDVIFESVHYDLVDDEWVEGAQVLVSPTTDAARTTTWYVQCREEGIRKYYPVWDAASGAAIPMEGLYRGRQVYRVRRGAPI